MPRVHLPPIFDRVPPEAHVLVVGKTGGGKSMLLRALLERDARTNRAAVLLDPHGDLAKEVARDVPRFRKNDLVLLDPTDPACRGVNPLRGVDPADRALVVANVLAAIRKLFPDNAWGHRTEYLLRHALAGAAELRGGSIADAAKMLVDETCRERMLRQVKDVQVVDFFGRELPSWSKAFASEAITAPANKLSAVLASPLVRAVLTKGRPRLDVAKAIARGALLIANLSKGKIGEDAARLLGGLLLGMVQSAIFARADLPREDRKPVRVVVDEITSFPASILLELLAEGRKFGASVVAATQSLAALPPDVRAGLLGNVGVIVAFRLGGEDAELLRPELGNELGVATLTSLGPGTAAVRIGGSRPVVVDTWG